MSSPTGGRRQFLAQLGLAAAGAGGIVRGRTSAEPPRTDQLSNQSPRQFQVLQRTGFAPRQGHEHAAQPASLGEALVTVRGEVAAEYAERFEYRVELWDGAYGQPLDWQPCEVTRDVNRFEGQIRIPAGGWYRLRIRGHSADGKTATDSQEPFGVGEVFLIAGQSYAAGANDEPLRVTEPHNRVVAFDLARSSWQVAHDPQPAVGDGGTIWPPLGDLLVPLLRTPVAFANAAAGGTSSRQWLPGEPLFANLVKTAQAIGGFRAVLWQQGESDVIEKTPTRQYVDNLVSIRAAFAQQTGSQAPWLLAKSTLHPTVYNDPPGEQRIRDAIDELARRPGFRLGPDTDILGGENRGGPATRRHFTGIGQRRAAQLWFAEIWHELMTPRTDEAAS